jgi:hypothetical protein
VTEAVEEMPLKSSLRNICGTVEKSLEDAQASVARLTRAVQVASAAQSAAVQEVELPRPSLDLS